MRSVNVSRLVRVFSEKFQKYEIMKVRICTPTQVILDNSQDVENIAMSTLDGGRTILTNQHQPMQTMLKPGLLKINWRTGGNTTYAITGGIIQKNKDNSVDCALFEAFTKEELDWEELKKSDSFTVDPEAEGPAQVQRLKAISIGLRDKLSAAHAAL